MFGFGQRFDIVVYDGNQTEIGGECIAETDEELLFRLDDGRVVSADACLCYTIKEATLNSQNNLKEENNLMTINANNLNFYSDKQWEEYDILTKLDGYELDYQNDSSGWIKVVKLEWYGDWIVKSDAIRIHKDGRIEHV